MKVPSSAMDVPQQSGRDWIWILVVAVALTILGLAAMTSLLFSAALYVTLVGWLLIIAGVVQIGGAFVFRSFGGLGAEIFFGALSIVLGALLVWAPVVAGSLIALVFVIGVIIDAVLAGVRALFERRPGWIWPLLIALVSVVLGLFIIFNPSLLLPLLGLLVGVNLLIRGVVLLLLAFEVRKLGSTH